MDNNSATTFIDFRVVNISFAVKSDFHGSGQARVRTEFKLRHEYNDRRLQVFMLVTFDDVSAPFSLEVEGAGLFETHAAQPSAALEKLTSGYCAQCIFPYLREVVADITRRAGFPPLHIPQAAFHQALDTQQNAVQPHTLH